MATPFTKEKAHEKYVKTGICRNPDITITEIKNASKRISNKRAPEEYQITA